MRYYVFNYRYRKSKNVINYGDNLQSLAVIDMLKKFGITDSEFGYIVRDDAGREDLRRVPGIFIPAGSLSWNFYPSNDDCPINDQDLRVMYFGVRIADGCFDIMRASNDFINSLKKCEPIGCRDVSTRDFVRSLGVKAYLSKCVTLSLDSRSSQVNGKSIYIFKETDVEEFRAVIPSEIWAKHKELPVLLDAPNGAPMSDDDPFQVNQAAQERLLLLKEDAKLVITSRIHLAIPCAALGIPVIFIDKYPMDPRTSIARMLLPYHSIGDLKNIDLEAVSPIDFSEEKRVIRLLFGHALQREERILGLDKARLTTDEHAEARDILGKLCEEDGPLGTYKNHSFSTEVMIECLLGERKIEIKKAKNKVVLFGAGEFGARLKIILARYGVEPSYFVDNSITGVGKVVHQGLPVISFNDFIDKCGDFFVIISAPGYQKDIAAQLAGSGFPRQQIIDSSEFCRKYIEYIPPLH